MQKNISINSKDKKFNIYGVLDQKAETDRIIIFVHGLTGHKNEHQFFNAAKFFNLKNFATFRFDLYSGEKKGRRLEECAISTHSDDINEVVKFFRKKFSRIYLVGHSLGGPSILGADIGDIKKIVLWDPSLKLADEDDGDWYHFDKRIKAYVINWGTSYVAGSQMINEWKRLDYQKWIDNCAVPLKIICAGQGVLKNDWKKLINRFKCKNKLVVIPGAGHCFDEEGAEGKLFKETLSWF